MNIVHATWEKRNLGVETIEIKIEPNEKTDELIQFLQNDNTDYVVARVPAGNMEASFLLQKYDFVMMEAAVKMETVLRNFVVPKKFAGICSQVAYHPMNEDELAVLYAEIDKGMFKTDRIYLDPYFTHEIAARRYKNWIGDLVSQGVIPNAVTYQGEQIGFFINKIVDGKFSQGALAGTYSAYEGTGMGACVQYAGAMWAKDNQLKSSTAFMSANNPQVLRASELFGSVIKEIEYVYIKHNK